MRSSHLSILLLVSGTAVGITLLAPLTWLVLLTDGLFAVAVFAAAAGWGAWPTAWLGFRDRSFGQQLCIALALGLGILSTLTLVLGVAGLLNCSVAWTLLATGGVCGVLRVHFAQPSASSDGTGASFAGRHGAGLVAVRALLLLPLAVPLVVVLFGASLPPGMLWQEEANGYDVLEYHLQCPREYYQAGRITFLQHNVYASFPQQMEMLYLLLMYLVGDVYAAAIPAQLLHAAFGILAAIALGCWTKPGWPRWVVVLLAGGTPWLAHVGCLAYVENGMLFFAAVAAGLLSDHFRQGASDDWRGALTAGLCAGLAGGCKYTALAFVGGALALAWFLTMPARFKLRARRCVVFGVGGLLAFSPWLVRNVAFAGNPVYPFAYDWFGGKAWSAEQARQWSEGHRVPLEHDSLTGRLALAARELFGSADEQAGVYRPSLFGQVLFLLGMVGVVLGWSRRAAMLIIWGALIFLAWVSLTFIPARFAMPLIVPFALLAGGSLGPRQTAAGPVPDGRLRLARWQGVILLVALLGVVVNDVTLVRRLRDHDRRWTERAGVPMRMLVGRTDVLVRVRGQLLNEALPSDAYAWLVGDAAVFYLQRRSHYTVPFSPDPWIMYAAETADPQACLDWLRGRNVSHVVFNWSEIERLRRTYGFSEVVRRDWVARLEQAGLRRVRIPGVAPGRATTEVYEVLPAAGD